jgi:diguanylate cyclase (GGDEF)-like protein
VNEPSGNPQFNDPATLSVRTSEAERERRIALTDGVTSLANRPALLLETGRSIDRSSRHQRHAGLLIVDVDRFSLVDDALGRPTGNNVLCVIADRLVKASRGHDVIARLEGDRFAVLLDMLTDPHEVIAVASRIESALREPMNVGEHTIGLTATIGIAVSDGSVTAVDLLDQAQAALIRAKRSGGARWEIFDAAMRAEAVGRLRMESELRIAIGSGALRPWFQPIVNVSNGEVVAIEAFVRWIHPDLGVLAPAAFLPVAEESGLLPGLWRVVLEDSVTLLSKLRSYPHLGGLGVVLNLSTRQLGQPGLVVGLQAKLERHGLPASSFTLDIKMDTLMNLPLYRPVLNELRDLGVGLALDDVGSGALPIAQLREFPIDVLKIDRSLTAAMSSGSTESGMVLGLVHVARAMNASLIAEGVERVGVLRQLEAAGVNLVQGHLICPALPFDELEQLLLQPLPFADRLRGDGD